MATLCVLCTSAFVAPPTAARSFTPAPTMKLGDGTKGAMGGAALGGLLAGPFGAIWGSQIGGSIGAARGADKANEERLER
eukprot:1490215-Prymnesium_polylepis.1